MSALQSCGDGGGVIEVALHEFDAFCCEGGGSRGGRVAGDAADVVGFGEERIGEDCGGEGRALLACYAEDDEEVGHVRGSVCGLGGVLYDCKFLLGWARVVRGWRCGVGVGVRGWIGWACV